MPFLKNNFCFSFSSILFSTTKISEQNLNHLSLIETWFSYISMLIHDSRQQNKIEHKREKRKHKMSLSLWAVCRIVNKAFPKTQIQIFRLTFKTSSRYDLGFFLIKSFKNRCFFFSIKLWKISWCEYLVFLVKIKWFKKTKN
jgi:hypothetical protein